MVLFDCGPVEKKIYSLRSESPLVIPQIDPDKFGDSSKVFKNIAECGINHIAIGGSIVDPDKMKVFIESATKDFDFSVITYITNSSIGLIKGIKGKTAVYWMSVANSENPYYFRDNLIMLAPIIEKNNFETIPTAYVFDDRGYVGTANWLTRSIPIPRDKKDISLAVALAMEKLGVRFYIAAGGSGCSLAPPPEHISLLREKTDLFIIPTSGIKTKQSAEELFKAGADAIHVGQLIEEKKGFEVLRDMIKSSKKFSGRDIL